MDNLDIPYKFRDFCQDDYADYVSCARTNPRILENSFIYAIPLAETLSSCKALRTKWMRCEDYREKELFEEMKRIYDIQKDLV